MVSETLQSLTTTSRGRVEAGSPDTIHWTYWTPRNVAKPSIKRALSSAESGFFSQKYTWWSTAPS